MDGDGTAPVSSPASLGGGLTTGASAAVAAACFALVLLYIFGRFACQYRKDLPPRSGGGTGTSTSAASRPLSCPPRTACGCGAGEAEGRENEMASLPVFVHVAGVEGEEEKAPRCAVCLAEFAHGEAGRLLPGCGHGFHAACIEAWIRVNSNCPLCRGAVVAGADDRSVQAGGRG